MKKAPGGVHDSASSPTGGGIDYMASHAKYSGRIAPQSPWQGRSKLPLTATAASSYGMGLPSSMEQVVETQSNNTILWHD